MSTYTGYFMSRRSEQWTVQVITDGGSESNRSLPMWERGLKHNRLKRAGWWNDVAPYVGAWIETASCGRKVLALA